MTNIINSQINVVFSNSIILLKVNNEHHRSFNFFLLVMPVLSRPKGGLTPRQHVANCCLGVKAA
jgi:hypothetical protein